MGVPTAIMIVLFYDVMSRMGLKKHHAVLLTAAIAFGSFYLPYTTVFNNHTFAGVSIFTSFFFLFRVIQHKGMRGWNVFFSGLFAGLALVVDIIGAAPFVLAFLLYTLMIGLKKGWYKPLHAGLLLWGPLIIFPILGRFITRRKVRFYGIELWGNFILGMIIFIAIHLYFNFQITGSFKPIYALQSLYTKLAVEGYYGEVIKSGEGIFSEARWRYIVNSLFGIRGLFLYTPLLLFSLYFMFKVAADRLNRFSRLSILILIFLIPSWIYLIFETNNYGGTSYGSRYFIASQPMLFFFNCYLYRYGIREKMKGWFYEAFRLSVLAAIVGMAFPWGVAGELPSSNFSFFNNIQYWSQNFLSVLAQLVSG